MNIKWKEMVMRNPIAKFSHRFNKPSFVPAKKGPGSYTRKGRKP
jgi:hypothetical protein